ncbi:hypothetical protein Pint_36060 [Pistacia integerrima]|uniref:Uncharacterized protein n=1 Tax=Pistacia integerrima TaxID=434235 RepID=A0ACC0XZF5_9ROSI|nr:hypothetical protein Pint_36060 [Pistacia integerrima]
MAGRIQPPDSVFELSNNTVASNPSLRREWRMVLVDLRNHAWSVEIEGLALPHDMANAAIG